jgi:hypothetical protein
LDARFLSPQYFFLRPSFCQLTGCLVEPLAPLGINEALRSDLLLEDLHLLIENFLSVKDVAKGGLIPRFQMLFEVF